VAPEPTPQPPDWEPTPEFEDALAALLVRLAAGRQEPEQNKAT
jgi:hypothetical protein